MASTSLQSAARPSPRIRLATPADKEAWIDANIKGYELDPQYPWRFPRRKEFPQDSRNGTAGMFDKYLKNETLTCLVAELPRIGEDGELMLSDWVVVAIAVWEWKDLEEVETEAAPSSFTSPTAKRRDMDPVRQKTFIDLLTASEKQYFGPEFGNRRLVLADLAADPKYHRRGAGRAMMDYGLALAKEHNVAITLTSSPLGRHLYTNVGFKELAYVDCGDEGSEERVGVWLMVWVPEGWKETTPHK